MGALTGKVVIVTGGSCGIGRAAAPRFAGRGATAIITGSGEADDIIYYRQRAETELEQARRATKPEAVKAHCALADAYLERIDQLERSAGRTGLPDACPELIDDGPALCIDRL